MIEKNRLEELIGQETTIWVQNKYCETYSVELNHLYHIGITDNKESLLYWDESIDEGTTKEEVLVDYLEYLYETEEDAEFASEFQNIKRVETLTLPTWEMFIHLGIPFEFTNKNGECFYLELCDEEGIDKIEIYNKIGFISNVFSSLATKENYFEACKEARRLFLGGKNE